MSQNPVLQEDSDIRIEHYPTSPEDYLLFLLRGKNYNILFPRMFKRICNNFQGQNGFSNEMHDRDMTDEALRIGLSVDSLGLGMAKAYIENERRYQDLRDEQR